VEFSYPTQEE